MRTCPQCGYTEPVTKPDNRRKIDSEDHGEIERLYSEGELTMGEIGDRYGVTRERIRQILPLGAATANRTRRRKEALTERFLASCQRALNLDLHCRTCGGWILRGPNRMIPHLECSPECARAHDILHDFDDHEGHRRKTARAYLASPEKYKASVLEWSEAMLSDDPPPPNRRYLIPGSARAEAIRKYRPEQYAALTRTADV